MRPSGASKWLARAGCAVLVFALTVGTSGLVQAITGAGTPCDGCGAHCYQYHAGLPQADSGCQGLSGQAFTLCLMGKCGPGSTWCNGCITNNTYSTDCESENCWLEGSHVGDGSICSDYCNGAACSGTTSKHCGQVTIPCDGQNSLACTKCSCKQD